MELTVPDWLGAPENNDEKGGKVGCMQEPTR